MGAGRMSGTGRVDPGDGMSDGTEQAPEYGRRESDDRWWPRFKHQMSANRGAVIASAFFFLVGGAVATFSTDLIGAPEAARRANARTTAIIEDSIPALRADMRDRFRGLENTIDARLDTAEQQRERLLRAVGSIYCTMNDISAARCDSENPAESVPGG